MLTKLLSIAGGWTTLIQYGVIAALISAGLYLVNDYKSLGVKNANLKTELSLTKNKLEVVEASRILDRDAIRALDERLKQKTGDLGDFCKILQDAAGSTAKEANEAVGEPIGSTLEALKKHGAKKK